MKRLTKAWMLARCSLGPLAVALMLGPLLLGAVFSTRAHADEGAKRDPAHAAAAAYEALRAGDAAAYEALVPTKAKYLELLKQSLVPLTSEARAAAEARIEREGGVEAMATKKRQAGIDRFASARAEASKELTWSEVAFVGLDHSKQRVRGVAPVAVREIRFLVRHGSEMFVFTTRHALHLDGRWVFLEGLRFTGRVGRVAAAEADRMRLERDEMQGALSQVKEDLARVQRSYEESRAELKELYEAMQNRERTLREQSGAQHEELIKAMREAHDEERAMMNAARDRILADYDQTYRALADLGPIILTALESKETKTRDPAEVAARELGLREARPHFQRVLSDKKALSLRRVGAVELLMKTGDPEAFVDRIKALVAEGVGRGDADGERASQNLMFKLLVRAGLPEAEAGTIVYGE